MASATVKVLRAGVDEVATTCRQEAAATAWHAEPIMRFFCSTFSDDLAGVGVSEDNFIVITAKFRAENRIGTMIAAGPEGTCACKISACDTHVAARANSRRDLFLCTARRMRSMSDLSPNGY